jgi:hypothetical protein
MSDKARAVWNGKGIDMKTIKSGSQNQKEKIIGAIFVILAILCIALFTIAMIAVWSIGNEGYQITLIDEDTTFGQLLDVENEVPQEGTIIRKDTELDYGIMNRFVESLADFDQALSINSDNGWAVFYQSIVTQKMAAPWTYFPSINTAFSRISR